MIKTLAAQIKEFKKESVLTPVFMILEVVFETLIPLMMASIIDDGVEAGDMRHIYIVGAFMVASALCGLFCGQNSEQGHPPVLRETSGSQCLTTYRHFPFPIWINSVRRDW